MDGVRFPVGVKMKKVLHMYFITLKVSPGCLASNLIVVGHKVRSEDVWASGRLLRAKFDVGVIIRNGKSDRQSKCKNPDKVVLLSWFVNGIKR